MLVTAVILGVVGLIVGSFMGLVSLRLPAERPVVVSRSRCDGCGRALGPIDLVPVLSFAATRGRCRTCAAPIPVRYPAIEAASAGLGVWAALATVDPVVAVFTALLAWQLLLIAVVDAEHFWLPDALTAPLAVSGAIAVVLLPELRWVDAALGAGIGFGGLALLRLAYRRLRGREGLGGGDPILFGAIGVWVGWQGLPSVLLWAALAGFALVLARVMLRRRVAGDDRLPFGVCLALGAWTTWLIGPLGL